MEVIERVDELDLGLVDDAMACFVELGSSAIERLGEVGERLHHRLDRTPGRLGLAMLDGPEVLNRLAKRLYAIL